MSLSGFRRITSPSHVTTAKNFTAKLLLGSPGQSVPVLFGALAVLSSRMFCEKAIELIRELHRVSDGQLPAFNVSIPGGIQQLELRPETFWFKV